MLNYLKTTIGVIGGSLLYSGVAFAGGDSSSQLPEPGTLALMAVGGAGLYLLRRRSQK